MLEKWKDKRVMRKELLALVKITGRTDREILIRVCLTAFNKGIRTIEIFIANCIH